MSAAAPEPTPGGGLRDRLRTELARLREQAADPRALADLEQLQARLDEGAPVVTVGAAPWAAGTPADRARVEADELAAIEAARRGKLAGHGWRPAGEAVADELRRRGLR